MESLNVNVRVPPPRVAADQSEGRSCCLTPPFSAGRRLSRCHGLISTPKGPRARTYTAEMAAAENEELPALCAGNDALSAETNQGDGEEKETGPEADEQPCSVETKMEADEEKPATEAYKATGEVVTNAGSAAEETAVPQEPEPKPDALESPAEVSDELASEIAAKETKQDSGEDSQSSGLDGGKSKSLGEDGEKPGGGGGELGDKRRPSVEMSSSDGEPLSRMDSEDR